MNNDIIDDIINFLQQNEYTYGEKVNSNEALLSYDKYNNRNILVDITDSLISNIIYSLKKIKSLENVSYFISVSSDVYSTYQHEINDTDTIPENTYVITTLGGVNPPRISKQEKQEKQKKQEIQICILNTKQENQEGSHWIVVFKNITTKQIDIFDSLYSKSINLKDIKKYYVESDWNYLFDTNKEIKKNNGSNLQGSYNTCGIFVLLFIFTFIMNYSNTKSYDKTIDIMHNINSSSGITSSKISSFLAYLWYISPFIKNNKGDIENIKESISNLYLVINSLLQYKPNYEEIKKNNTKDADKIKTDVKEFDDHCLKIIQQIDEFIKEIQKMLDTLYKQYSDRILNKSYDLIGIVNKPVFNDYKEEYINDDNVKYPNQIDITTQYNKEQLIKLFYTLIELKPKNYANIKDIIKNENEYTDIIIYIYNYIINIKKNKSVHS